MVYLPKYFQNHFIIPKFASKIISLANYKIVITGGPSTGKTTIIEHLEQIGETCYQEVSRAIIQEAQKNGVDQLFLEDPTLFSRKLLEGRVAQFEEAKKVNQSRVFLDRGIPDVVAYMNYAKESSPLDFIKACKENTYDLVFVLPPWEKIHKTDNERYESFDQAQEIYHHLLDTYTDFGYNCIEVPFGNVKERSTFILQHVK